MNLKRYPQFINENKEDFDFYAANIALSEDGYDNIKKQLGAKYDVDLKELQEKEFFLWETEKLGDITCTLEKHNVWTVTCRSGSDDFGKCTTYDLDETGLAYCFMSALKDLLRDVSLSNEE